MDGQELHRQAALRAEELPASELTHLFGDDWDVYKVRGKVFMLQTDITGEPLVTLKSDPAESKALQAAHGDVTPGDHMNKRHWITLHPGGDFETEQVRELVTESYRLVLRKLPKAQRPVDPSTFGIQGRRDRDIGPATVAAVQRNLTPGRGARLTGAVAGSLVLYHLARLS